MNRRESPDTLDEGASGSHCSRCMERLSELETFLSRGRDRPLSRFVERELRGFLECGILAHGFVDAPGIPRDGMVRCR